MLSDLLKGYDVVLASQSPRRKQLLSDLGVDFRVDVRSVDEVYPEGLAEVEIPVYLSKLKAEPFVGEIEKNQIVITSDTIVALEGCVLGKPTGHDGAVEMLRSLSGKRHQVISGVCLTMHNRQHCFASTTDVYFKELTEDEINYYVTEFKPFDKAGSYGIQEWIGYIGIERIDGSYFNVMGLPVQRLYEEMIAFLQR